MNVTRGLVTSDAVTITGINTPVAIQLSGGEWSRNGGAFQTASGSVHAGDTITLRTESARHSYTSVNVNVQIGDQSDVWTVTTGKR